MPILQQYLVAIGSFQGLLLASLLIFDRTLSNASRILGAWCLATEQVGLFELQREATQAEEAVEEAASKSDG